MLVLAILIAGARGVRHVCYLANDPLVELAVRAFRAAELAHLGALTARIR